MKKNKDIEVQIEETVQNKQGETITIYELKIGKKMIGRVEAVSDKKYDVIIDGEKTHSFKNVEEAFEEIIRHWNLFQ